MQKIYRNSIEIDKKNEDRMKRSDTLRRRQKTAERRSAIDYMKEENLCHNLFLLE